MSALDQMVVAGFGIVSLMFVLWLVHLRTIDAGIVDFGWAAGLGLTAVFYVFTSPNAGGRQVLLVVLAGLWSFRLTGYLLINRVLTGPEDGRYQTLRQKWGGRAPAYFLGFFLFQAFLVLVFSIPYLVVAWNHTEGPTIFDFVGVFILAGSILGEFVADRQLARFVQRV